MTPTPRIQSAEEIRINLAIERTLAEARPHVAEVLRLLLERCSQLWARVQQLEQQARHVPRLAQTVGAVVGVLPVFRCANNHDMLGPVAPRGQDAPCPACGGLAVPVTREELNAQQETPETRDQAPPHTQGEGVPRTPDEGGRVAGDDQPHAP
jgi:hypothetical protein